MTAYIEGFDALLSGKDATAVPYRKTTEKWFEWLDGWKDQDHHLRGRDEAIKQMWSAPSLHKGDQA